MILSLERFLDPRKVHVYADDRMLQWKLGERFLPPLTMEIHPTNACNYRCSFCAYRNRRSSKPEAAFNVEMYDRIVDVLMSGAVKGLYISGGGEPLLAPHILEYIPRFACYAKVFLVTNGYLLAKGHALHVCEFLDWLQVSIHSGRQRNYKDITSVDGLRDVLQIPRLVREHVARAPTVGALCVVTNDNYYEIQELVETLRDAGFDYVRLKPVIDYEKRGLALSEDAVRSVSSQASAKAELCDSKFTNLGSFASTQTAQSRVDEFCCNVELSLNCIISADGHVYLSMAHVGETEYSIGDIRSEPFSQIWGSPQHSSIIDKMRREYRSGLCRNCRFMAYNRELTNSSEDRGNYLRPEFL